MIIATTPLRISLFGGSTDHPSFINEYGYGSVISFASNLKTYVSLSQDTFGYNQKDHKYIINYSRREEVDKVDDIQNELVKAVFKQFELDPLMVTLTSDVFSQGSGLASSSSYIISLIKAISMFKNITITDSEICALAYKIELSLNPYCGLQDPYGCGIGGFKRLEFDGERRVKVEFLPGEMFDEHDIYLLFTGITRDSKSVLRDISINVQKSFPLLKIVDHAYDALLDRKYDLVFEYLRESWNEKKKTSELIIGNRTLRELDDRLNNNSNILAHKLCGAGNGGFFVCFTEKNCVRNDQQIGIKVSLSTDGIGGYVV
jgi:D-glycero-alpha-D-manno-heptose-7-phosphate kinase